MKFIFQISVLPILWISTVSYDEHYEKPWTPFRMGNGELLNSGIDGEPGVFEFHTGVEEDKWTSAKRRPIVKKNLGILG